MSIYAEDRRILDIWAALGAVPDEPSTRGVASELLLKLWADYRESEAVIAQLLALGQEPVDPVAQLAMPL